MPPKLGILAGGGDLPARLAKAALGQGREVFILAIEGHAEPASLPQEVETAWIRLGAAGQGFDTLRQARVEDVVIVGRVRRPSLKELMPDKRAAAFFARVGLKALGDDGLLKGVIQEFESEGFRILGVDDLLADLLAREGVYGKFKPDAQQMADIERGLEVALGLGRLDVGQGVIVQQGLVLGVEAIEGTDALIARSASVKREGQGGVLVKLAKPQQERRADLPAIGLDTVRNAAQAGLCGIAIEAGRTLVVDAAAVTAEADRAGLFLIGVKVLP
jgi:DUF1009 family protein